MYRSNCLRHLADRNVFEQVATRPALHRLQHTLLVMIHGEHDNRDVWKILDNLARHRDTINDWNVNIHKHYVGLEPLNGTQRLDAIDRLAHDSYSILQREQLAQPLTNKRMIVH